MKNKIINFFKKNINKLNISLFILSIIFGVLLNDTFDKIFNSKFNYEIYVIFSIIFSVFYFIVARRLIQGKNKDLSFSSEENRKRFDDICNLNTDKEFLKQQYESAQKSEQFYEDIAWKIGGIFIPISITLISASVTGGFFNKYSAIIGGLSIYLIWLVLFARFRANIRLFRNVSMLLENKLNGVTLQYVYKWELHSYGKVIRVWTVLVFIGLLLLDFGIYALFII